MLSYEIAERIASDARFIAKAQRDIADATMLIETLESLQEGQATIAVSTFLRPEPYSCMVSNASAICLLRESVELKQQQIKILSEHLRITLKE